MRSWNSSLALFFFSLFLVLLVSASASSIDHHHERIGHRVLMSFKEISKEVNRTFNCSPSGPCVPCIYSEKSDKKYRCSETTYRIPFKCIETSDDSKAENREKNQKGRSESDLVTATTNENLRKRRSLLEDSSTSEGGTQAYITYRSCIPAVNEEKLSVLGFEGIVFGVLLISGSVVFLRKRRFITMPGVSAGRIQPNSRF